MWYVKLTACAFRGEIVVPAVPVSVALYLHSFTSNHRKLSSLIISLYE